MVSKSYTILNIFTFGTIVISKGLQKPVWSVFGVVWRSQVPREDLRSQRDVLVNRHQVPLRMQNLGPRFLSSNIFDCVSRELSPLKKGEVSVRLTSLYLLVRNQLHQEKIWIFFHFQNNCGTTTQIGQFYSYENSNKQKSEIFGHFRRFGKVGKRRFYPQK